MSDTNIEWADKVWNPVVGCSRISDGCTHCYAETMSSRFFEQWTGKEFREWSARNAAHNVTLRPNKLEEPLHWKKPVKIFTNSMSDLFHEEIQFEYIAAVFGVMAAARQHTFQILTKRPARMLEFFEWIAGGSSCPASICLDHADERMIKNGLPIWNRARRAISEVDDPEWPLPNVWLGVSCENQKTANERIPLLLRTPSAIRFVSAEPLLERVNLQSIKIETEGSGGPVYVDSLKGKAYSIGGSWDFRKLHWVIVGGESGSGARPCNVEWIRGLIHQCKSGDVPVFVKQVGAWAYENDGWYGSTREEALKPLQLTFHGKKIPPFLQIKDKKGGAMEEWPEDLRIREMPK